MIRRQRLLQRGIVALACAATISGWAARAAEPDGPAILPSEGWIRMVNGTLVRMQDEPAESRQPEQSRQPESFGGIQSPNATERGASEFLAMLQAAERAGAILSSAASPVVEAISPSQQSAPAMDLVNALEKSDVVQTVNSQLRNQASFDPRIRAYRYGQIYTQVDGAVWVPVRQDLDTPLSMFDPSIVQSLEVTPGPYLPMAGAGFAYLNAMTAPTPRYDGFEAHGFLGTDYFGNGDQLNATQRFYGGNSNWGFSILHASRTGNAYRAGNGVYIPAAYNNEDFFAQFGFNLDTDRKVEFRYLRQDQTNTQYPGQFFQTNIQITQGFNLNYVDESVDGPWTRLVGQGWYNIGRLQGATNPTENVFQVVQRVDTALQQFYNDFTFNPNFTGNTNAGTYTTGARVATVYGDDGDQQFTTGADARLINQYVNENLSWQDPSQTTIATNTGLPRSYQVDPGLFAQWTVPTASYWTSTIGGRVDWLYSNVVSPFPSTYPSGDPNAIPNYDINLLPQSNVLYSLFWTNKVELDEDWTARFGAGVAQRAPTLTERYADGEFLALIQNGFSRVVGQPNIPIEKAWQLDANLACDYDTFRGRISGFCSLIQNFSTFSVLGVNQSGPAGAQLLFTQTTPLATLAGCEMYAEKDLNSYWTGFGSLLYVDGRDQTINAPLTQIYPLEARTGLRLHDPDGGKQWGVEMFARMVHAQNRLGTLRSGPDGQGPLDVLEQRTGGFTVTNLRGYWNATKNLSFVAGINNLFDRSYLEHLSLRFAQNTVPSGGNFPGIGVYSPGFTPYVGLDWTF